MKILLDECLPLDFRHHLTGHEVHTAEWAGFKSLKNGRLLEEAESAGYGVFLTPTRVSRISKTWLGSRFRCWLSAHGRTKSKTC